MAKKITKHHNVDNDVIYINKDTLTLKLLESKDFYNSSNSFFGFGGAAISLIPLSLFTDTFKNTAYLSGEATRGLVLGVGIICSIIAIRSALTWHRLKNSHEPKVIVSSLLKTKTK